MPASPASAGNSCRQAVVAAHIRLLLPPPPPQVSDEDGAPGLVGRIVNVFTRSKSSETAANEAIAEADERAPAAAEVGGPPGQL